MTFLKKTIMGASALAFTIMAAPSAFAQDDFTIKLGGRLHVDYASANSDNTDFDVSATALRRARLKGSGQFGKNLKYKIETTFDEGGDVNLEDAYLSWKPDGSPIAFKAGHFKTSKSQRSLIITKYNWAFLGKISKRLKIMTAMKASLLQAAPSINSTSPAVLSIRVPLSVTATKMTQVIYVIVNVHLLNKRAVLFQQAASPIATHSLAVNWQAYSDPLGRSVNTRSSTQIARKIQPFVQRIQALRAGQLAAVTFLAASGITQLANSSVSLLITR